MNIIETVNEELKGRHLTDLEKLRLIYIRNCKLFSFDYRWFYTDLLKDKNTMRQIENRTIDLENVDDFSIVCHPEAGQVLRPLNDIFTSFNCKVRQDSKGYRVHSYLEVTDDNDRVWTLDPVSSGDLQTVKLGFEPLGMMCNTSGCFEELREMDESLGISYIDKQVYKDKMYGDTDAEKVRVMSKILDESAAKYHYSDAHYLMKLLSYNFIIDPVTYFDKDYDFHWLIECPAEDTYFDTSKKDNEYSIKEISKDEYESLTKTLRYK